MRMTLSKDLEFLRVVDLKVSTGCKMPVQQNIDVSITPFCQFFGDVSRNILLDFSSVTMEHINYNLVRKFGAFRSEYIVKLQLIDDARCVDSVGPL
ncbi:hypothetical protein AVEN_197922-1 [Araneus ventricosus]|uniref:Uncharacterized protein n=1 Tax=Araneus ventricosus TaxID=182803 RepID=A0A4Y2CJD6_ARAVE|nr:hypothetical protein AVEN_197922-1 [Araneus ventricosus]